MSRSRSFQRSRDRHGRYARDLREQETYRYEILSHTVERRPNGALNYRVVDSTAIRRFRSRWHWRVARAIRRIMRRRDGDLVVAGTGNPRYWGICSADGPWRVT